MKIKVAHPVEFMAAIKADVDAGYSMEAIAKVRGWHWRDLCEWIQEYRDPTPIKAHDYANRLSPAYAPRIVSADPWSKPPDARRFLMWRRQRDAATKARAEMVAAQ